MRCDDLRELLSAYGDGELSELQRQFVEEHLSDCAQCRKVLEGYRTVRTILSALEIPAVPDIEQSVLSKVSKSNSFSRGRLMRLPALVKVLVPGVLIALVALYFTLPSGSGNPAEFMARVYAATARLSLYRFTSSMAAVTPGQPEISHELDISYSAPSYYDIKVIQNGSKTSEIFLDEQKVYALTPELTGIETLLNFGNYESIELQLDLGISVVLSKEDTLELLSWLVNVKRLPDAKIDGVICFHYSGEVNMDKYAEKYRARLIEENPEIGDEAFLERFFDFMKKMNQHVELWAGKDDYLMRQTKLTVTSPDVEATIFGEYHYYYPQGPGLIPPVSPSGGTLPSWYLLTDDAFSEDSSYTIQYLADSRHLNVQVILTNISDQECSNIRVFLAPGDVFSNGQDIHSAVASPADTSLAPGEKQTYRASWDIPGSDRYTSYSATRRIFVEYLTGDGMECVEIISPHIGDD